MLAAMTQQIPGTVNGSAFGVGGWEIDILVTGFPGKSVHHGSLGWSTIALIRRGERLALVDCGAFGHRKLLTAELAARGLGPPDITDLLLTHTHYDHAVNWLLFPKARVAVGTVELDWALGEPWGETVVPELYVRELGLFPKTERIADGGEVFPGVTAHLAPGHTPGCLVFRLAGAERDVVFTGDAAKNRAELVSGDVDMTYDAAVSRASIGMIHQLWRARPGTVLIPGHDLPMMLGADGRPLYLGRREAALDAWFGDGMDEVTRFQLTVEGTP